MYSRFSVQLYTFDLLIQSRKWARSPEYHISHLFFLINCYTSQAAYLNEIKVDIYCTSGSARGWVAGVVSEIALKKNAFLDGKNGKFRKR